MTAIQSFALLGVAGPVEGAGWGRFVVFVVLEVVVGICRRSAGASPMYGVAMLCFFSL